MEEITLVWADKAKEQARDIYGYLYDGSVAYATIWTDKVQQPLGKL